MVSMYTHAADAMDTAVAVADATVVTETADAAITTTRADAAVATKVVAAVINMI